MFPPKGDIPQGQKKTVPGICPAPLYCLGRCGRKVGFR
jgi:hypothetical protein